MLSSCLLEDVVIPDKFCKSVRLVSFTELWTWLFIGREKLGPFNTFFRGVGKAGGASISTSYAIESLCLLVTQQASLSLANEGKGSYNFIKTDDWLLELSNIILVTIDIRFFPKFK